MAVKANRGLNALVLAFTAVFGGIYAQIRNSPSRRAIFIDRGSISGFLRRNVHDNAAALCAKRNRNSVFGGRSKVPFRNRAVYGDRKLQHGAYDRADLCAMVYRDAW